jgi:hypothetical protein
MSGSGVVPHYNDVIDSLLLPMVSSGVGSEEIDIETLRIHNNKLIFIIRKLAESQVCGSRVRNSVL